jgi:hypothetical protein
LPAARASPAKFSWSPAISSNYLQVRVSGEWPPNQMMQVRVVSVGRGHLDAQPETSRIFAV